jgi:hypothetical protein
MKKVFIICLVFAGLFSSIHLAEANVNPDVDVKNGLKSKFLSVGDVISIEVVGLSEGSRLFTISDGYEEKIMRKVLEWINTSSPAEGATELGVHKIPISLKLKMSNGDVAVIEPAYNCISENQTKICTAVDGEIIYTHNKIKVRLKSQELYDWLLVSWKYEVDGPPKEELLEETLYTRYFSYLDKTYSDFIMCPRIDKIERIDGDTRRHIVYASALDYAGHHDGPYDKINIILTDTPEYGVKINKVIRQKNISEKESIKQCR